MSSHCVQRMICLFKTHSFDYKTDENVLFKDEKLDLPICQISLKCHKLLPDKYFRGKHFPSAVIISC